MPPRSRHGDPLPPRAPVGGHVWAGSRAWGWTRVLAVSFSHFLRATIQTQSPRICNGVLPPAMQLQVCRLGLDRGHQGCRAEWDGVRWPPRVSGQLPATYAGGQEGVRPVRTCSSSRWICSASP